MNTRFAAKDTTNLQSAIAAYLARGGMVSDCNTAKATNSAQLGRYKMLYKSNSRRAALRGYAG
jgi:hypothetical protein